MDKEAVLLKQAAVLMEDAQSFTPVTRPLHAPVAEVAVVFADFETNVYSRHFGKLCIFGDPSDVCVCRL